MDNEGERHHRNEITRLWVMPLAAGEAPGDLDVSLEFGGALVAASEPVRRSRPQLALELRVGQSGGVVRQHPEPLLKRGRPRRVGEPALERPARRQ